MLRNYVNLSLLKTFSKTLFNYCVSASLLKCILKGGGKEKSAMGGMLKIN